ncbi:MAG: hypothetical protein ACTHWV_15070, partial [Brachybacterium sp.]
MFEYTGKIRRRARKIKNAAALVSNSELWPTCTPVKAYWWDYFPNFGDLLTLELLPHYGGSSRFVVNDPAVAGIHAT